MQALESGVIVNCQVKLMYRASDPETAEWASKLSGTKMVRVTKSQTVEHNRYGGEAYKAERMLTDVEVPIITENEMLSLSPRVGVLFVPERLASVVFTCFVSANTQRARQLIVRKFCLYRQRTEPNCFVPNSLYFARPQPYSPPVMPLIFTCMRSTDEST